MLTPYSTNDEKRFIDAIGTFSEATIGYTPEQLLRLYIEALQRREQWGGLKKDVILNHAYQRLAQYLPVKKAA